MNENSDIALLMAAKATARSSAWVLVKVGKKMLLGKRSREVANAGQWGLFGGSIEEGEDPKEGALRELEEEAGLSAKKGELKLLWRGKHPSDDKKHSYFYGWDAKGKVRDKVRINWETEEFGWFSRKDVDKLDKHFSLEDLARNWKKALA